MSIFSPLRLKFHDSLIPTDLDVPSGLHTLFRNNMLRNMARNVFFKIAWWFITGVRCPRLPLVPNRHSRIEKTYFHPLLRNVLYKLDRNYQFTQKYGIHIAIYIFPCAILHCIHIYETILEPLQTPWKYSPLQKTPPPYELFIDASM